MAEAEAGKYRFLGDKEQGHSTDRLLLEGNTADPEAKFLYVGEEAEMSAEQVQAFKDAGMRLSKVGDSDESEDDEEPKKGDDKTPDKANEAARRQASTGNKPTATQKS